MTLRPDKNSPENAPESASSRERRTQRTFLTTPNPKSSKHKQHAKICTTGTDCDHFSFLAQCSRTIEQCGHTGSDRRTIHSKRRKLGWRHTKPRDVPVLHAWSNITVIHFWHDATEESRHRRIFCGIRQVHTVLRVLLVAAQKRARVFS